jgi:hypothetical protein
MAMDRNTRWQVSQQFKRNQDIEVKQEDKDTITKIAIAHLAVGNTNEFMLAMNSLSKLQANQELTDKLDKLETVMSLVAGKVLKNETPE